MAARYLARVGVPLFLVAIDWFLGVAPVATVTGTKAKAMVQIRVFEFSSRPISIALILIFFEMWINPIWTSLMSSIIFVDTIQPHAIALMLMTPSHVLAKYVT